MLYNIRSVIVKNATSHSLLPTFSFFTRSLNTLIKKDFGENDYHNVADETMENLLTDFEDLLESHEPKASDVTLAVRPGSQNLEND